MRTIPLTHGREAIVDDCDYEYVMQWKWQFESGRHWRTGYATHSQRAIGRQGRLYMHRLVAERNKLPIVGKEVDHIDGDGLNNCRSNLRVSTTLQNSANRRPNRNNTSGFKGVTWNQRARKFQAYISAAGHRHHLKYWDDPRDAARAYNEAALKHFGEFACLNPV